MDSITHSLTGVGLYYVFNKKEKDILQRRVIFTNLVLSAIAPDVDILYYFLGNTEYFVHHSGVTHSLIGLIGFPVFITLLLKLLFKNTINVFYCFLGSFVGTLSHIILDLLNTYGTMVLWPINNYLYSFNILMIVDVIITTLLAVGLVFAFTFIKREYKRNIFIVIFLLITIYILCRTYIYFKLSNYINDEYSNISDYVMSDVFPTIIGIDKWIFIVQTKNEYVIGDVKYSTKSISVKKVVRKTQKNMVIAKALNTRLGNLLNRFSPYLNYEVKQNNNGYVVKIIDMRYSYYNFGFGGQVVLDKSLNIVSEKAIKYSK